MRLNELMLNVQAGITDLSTAMNLIDDSGFGQLMVIEENKPEPERNADGDTLEDMKAVWGEFGVGAGQIQVEEAPNEWFAVNNAAVFGEYRATQLRITAKHTDRFDAECMDFETWARAAIGRGMVVKWDTNGDVVWGDDYDEEAMWGLGSKLLKWSEHDYHNEGTWTAITKAQYDQETAPEQPKFDGVFVKTPDGSDWCPLADFAKAMAEEMNKS